MKTSTRPDVKVKIATALTVANSCDRQPCPLCAASCPQPFDDELKYFQCATCDLRFLHPRFRLSADEEEARYRCHNNDIEDPNYQAFVKPLFSALQPKLKPGAHGLDFGAGAGPVLARLFEKNGFSVALYDPFFWPDKGCLQGSYDFIVASEVVEHLYEPRREFAHLCGLLKPGGWLGIMTLLVTPKVDFASWYYRRDPTHVAFYSPQTFVYLSKLLGLQNLTYSGERIVLMQRPLHDKP